MTSIFKTYKIVLATGGFDPIHKGHIDYLVAAEKLGDDLCVGINSDEWLTRKKGKFFMSCHDRYSIIHALKCVTSCDIIDDSDDTARTFIQLYLDRLPRTQFIFANGGDRTNTTTPEYEMFKDHPRIEFAWGVGGSNKTNSSSEILQRWKSS